MRTSHFFAISAVSFKSSVVTENGEQGAMATFVIENFDLSWYLFTSLSQSLSMKSSFCTTESGGSPPLERPLDMEPLVAVNLMPISFAASISASTK